MPNTSLGLPYPLQSDTPDVPRDLQALASAVNGMMLNRHWALRKGSAQSVGTSSTQILLLPLDNAPAGGIVGLLAVVQLKGSAAADATLVWAGASNTTIAIASLYNVCAVPAGGGYQNMVAAAFVSVSGVSPAPTAQLQLTGSAGTLTVSAETYAVGFRVT